MPLEEWNGKFLTVGNGGWGGSIQYDALAEGVGRGFATASTDTGHEGGSASFGLGHPEKVIDFGWRSTHEMTVTAKQVIETSFDTLRSRFLQQEFNYKELSLHIDVDHRSGSENQRDAQQARFGEENVSTRGESAEEEILPRTYYHVASNGNESGLNIYV